MEEFEAWPAQLALAPEEFVIGVEAVALSVAFGIVNPGYALDSETERAQDQSGLGRVY